MLGGLVFPQLVHADRVVLLRPSGSSVVEQLDDLEERLAEAVLQVGHSAVTEGAPVDPSAAIPDSANELRAIGELQGASYVVVPSVTLLQDSYRLRLVVGYVAEESRRETIEVLVWSDNERDRLRDVMMAALRPEGFGTARGALEADPPRPEPDAPALPEVVPEPEQEEPASAPTPASAPPPPPPPSPWTGSAGVDLRPILRHPPERDGGVLVTFALRMGHELQAVPHFQLRGFAEGTTGAAGGLAVGGGAAYWFRPVADLDLRIGGAVEVGYYQALTGDQQPSFLLRGMPVVELHVSRDVFLEASVGEVQWLSSNDVISLGFGLRVGAHL